MEPDILYVVRRGERNNSLEYSLRSLANLPHRKVFIAGYCPQWVRGVIAVEVLHRVNKFDSIEENVRQGLRHPEMGDEVVYMNDDFYITRPIDSVPITHGGLIDEYQGKQELRIRMLRTLGALREQFPEPNQLYAYDGVHMPLPLELGATIAALVNIPWGCLWRTWYGNLALADGYKVSNAKYKGTYPVPKELPTFLSTNNHGLHVLREQLEDLLPKESPYV